MSRKMTHAQRFFFERWKERRAAKRRAKALALKVKKLKLNVKPSPGFWPGMYEGAPKPGKLKPIFYQELASKSVGFLKGVTKINHPKNFVRTAAPVAPINSNSSKQDLSGRPGGRKACTSPEFRTSIDPVPKLDRENQPMSAVLCDPKKVGQDG